MFTSVIILIYMASSSSAPTTQWILMFVAKFKKLVNCVSQHVVGAEEADSQHLPSYSSGKQPQNGIGGSYFVNFIKHTVCRMQCF